jgi:hypothetical protein
MTPELIKRSVREATDEDSHPLSPKIPTIKILIYTDDPAIVKKNDINLFGLGEMLKHLRGHAPTFADMPVEFVSRSENHHADHKLDTVLAQDTYDQIWFFGIHQANKKDFTLGIPEGGGPESELDENEVAKLEEWMRSGGTEATRGGGVLMTGDHANERPTGLLPSLNVRCPSDPTDEFLGLGRALGRCVPRAGLLRKWEGPPTRRSVDNVNTQVLTTSSSIDLPFLQFDKVPQRIIPIHFNEQGEPDENGRPHPLFLDKNGRGIDVFPDHMHEGEVTIPKDFDPTVWPQGARSQPKPQAVAYGTNKRNGERITLVAAYDGDNAGVGRIVSDSTWHHYFNINLTSFPHTENENPIAEQIGQFYANLAMWLSPLAKRREMAEVMFWWLARHPTMVEEVGSDVMSIGQTAYRVLSQAASACEIHELLQAACPQDLRQQYEMLYFPSTVSILSSLPSKERILGSIIAEYHKVLVRKPEGIGGFEAPSSIIERGFSEAIFAKAERVASTAVQALDNFQFLPQTEHSRKKLAITQILNSLRTD